MNLNPLYHLRKYRQQAERIKQLENELNIANKQAAQFKQENAKLKEQLHEVELEHELVIVEKTLTRKQARELRNHKGKYGKPQLPR